MGEEEIHDFRFNTKEVGLTSEQAKEKLKTELSKVINNDIKMNIFKLIGFSIVSLISIDTVLIGISVICFFISFGLKLQKFTFSNLEVIRIFIESILLLILFIFSIISKLINFYQKNTILSSRANKMYNQLKKNNFEFALLLSAKSLEGVESMDLMLVCRDGKWRRLPFMFLVENDLICCNNTDSLEHYEMTFKSTGEDGFYILKETMIARTIKESFPPYTKALVKSKIVAIFHLLTKNVDECIDENKKIRIPFFLLMKSFFSVLFSTEQIYDNLLCLGSITNVFFIDRDGVLSDEFYIPSRVLMFKSEEEIEYSKRKQDEEEEEEDEEDAFESQKINLIKNEDVEEDIDEYEKEQELEEEMKKRDEEQTEIELKNMEESDLAFYKSPVPSPSPCIKNIEEILEEDKKVESENFLSNKDLRISNVDEEESKTESRAFFPPQDSSLFKILDINKDTSSEFNLKFEDDNWESHMTSLKPLGLNCILTTKSDLSNEKKCLCEDSIALWKKYVYLLGKEIGFQDDIIDIFKSHKEIHTQRGLQQISSVIVSYEDGFQIHSHGEPTLLIDYCSHYFDGFGIQPLQETIKKELIQTYKNWRFRKDLYVVAVSFSPIDNKYQNFVLNNLSQEQSILHIDDESEIGIPFDTEESEIEKLNVKSIAKTIQKGQIFLGMIGLGRDPKNGIQQWIENLYDNSGIRFIYASPKNEQRSKAFGQKLGIDTGWNSCISLEETGVELDESDLKAQLPHGIEQIKSHLKSVDNVPLLVSLFCDVNSKTSKELIKILQDNGEIVLSIGSSTAVQNSPIYVQSNVAISVDPSSFEEQTPAFNLPLNSMNNTLKSFQNSGAMVNFPCQFQVKNGNIFSLVYQLIKETRRLEKNMKQSFECYLIFNLILFFIQFFGILGFLPPIMDGIQMLWIMLVINPILSISLIFNPIEKNMMDLISEKNTKQNWNAFKRLIIILLKCFIPCIICFFMYTFTLTSFIPEINWSIVWGGTINQEIYQHNFVRACIVYAQNMTLLSVVIFMCLISVTEIHPYYSIFQIFPCRNLIWTFFVPLVIILQILFSFFSILIIHRDLPFQMYIPTKFPFYVYLIVLLVSLILILIIDELIKWRYRKRFFLQQKRLKLEFQTKLGMHS
eukprot:gene1167-10681_t